MLIIVQATGAAAAATTGLHSSAWPCPRQQATTRQGSTCMPQGRARALDDRATAARGDDQPQLCGPSPWPAPTATAPDNACKPVLYVPCSGSAQMVTTRRAHTAHVQPATPPHRSSSTRLGSYNVWARKYARERERALPPHPGAPAAVHQSPMAAAAAAGAGAAVP